MRRGILLAVAFVACSPAAPRPLPMPAPQVERHGVELSSGDGVVCARLPSDRVTCVSLSDITRPKQLDATGVEELSVRGRTAWLRTASGWTSVTLGDPEKSAPPEPGIHYRDWSCALSGGTLSCNGASLARDVTGVWSGGHLCVQRSDGMLACLRDDATLEKPSWDSIARYPKLQGMGAGRAIGCAAVDAGRVECWWWHELWDDEVDAGMTYDGELRGEPTPIPGLSGVVSLSVGAAHACALERDGRLSCWGQVSPVPERPPTRVRLPLTRATAVAAGAEHACALQNERAWCWGSNENKQLGRNSGRKDLPLPIDSVGGVEELALAGDHTCLRTRRGSVHCFGDPTARAPGQSSFVSAVPGIKGATALVISQDLGCVVQGGNVSCWGKLAGSLPKLAGASELSITERWVCGLVQGAVRCRDRKNAEVRTAFRKDIAHLSGSCALGIRGRVTCFAWMPHESHDPEFGEVLQTADMGIERAEALWVSAGEGCARIADGSTRCFRIPPMDMPEAGDAEPLPSPLAFASTLTGVTSVAFGRHRVCATTIDGHLHCAAETLPPFAPREPWTLEPQRVHLE